MVTHALLLIVAANAAPILVQRIFGDRWVTPVDLGACLPDGKPVFGPAKSWRGLLAAVLATAAIASLLGISPTTGALGGVVAMLGDLASSVVFLARVHAVPTLVPLENPPTSVLDTTAFGSQGLGNASFGSVTHPKSLLLRI
ncbi:MAG: CDP-archaeol synthase [Gammaproteobacteria bacterium]